MTRQLPAGIELSPFEECHLPAVLQLFERVFGAPIDERFYRWRFLDNPFGPAMVDLALDGERLAAHYAVCAARSSVGGAPVATAQSMTTMTAPEYGGKGLFPALADHLYERIARDHDVRAVFGFPNPNSHYSFRHKLGWQDLFALFFLRREMAKAQAEAWQVLDAADQQRLVTAGSPGHGSRLYERSWAFHQWRYLNNPLERYQVIGSAGASCGTACVTRVWQDGADETKRMDIVDFVGAQHPAELQRALTAVHGYAQEHDIAAAACWLDLGHPAYRALERLRYRPDGPITYCGILQMGEHSSELGLDPRNWRVTMGDSDVF